MWGDFRVCPLPWAVSGVRGPPHRAESRDIMSTELGAGGGGSATARHRTPTLPRMFHLINCEQKPKVLTHFHSYQSGGRTHISGQRVRREDPVGPHPCPPSMPPWPHRPQGST